MAWPGVPADVADGDYLPASWLNGLAAAARYQNDIGGASISGFREVWTDTGGATTWNIRHKHRYLKLLYSSNGDGGEVDYIKISFDGDELIDIDGGSPNTSTWRTVTLDLEDTGVITPTPTVGNNYTISVAHAFSSGGWLSIHWFGEQNNDDDL